MTYIDDDRDHIETWDDGINDEDFDPVMTYDEMFGDLPPEGELPWDVDYSDTEEIRPNPFAVWQSAGEPRPRLASAPVMPERRSLESFDRERVLCIHELARAMEEYATKQDVPLYGGRIEFEEAAREVLLIAHDQKCDLKGR